MAKPIIHYIISRLYRLYHHTHWGETEAEDKLNWADFRLGSCMVDCSSHQSLQFTQIWGLMGWTILAVPTQWHKTGLDLNGCTEANRLSAWGNNYMEKKIKQNACMKQLKAAQLPASYYSANQWITSVSWVTTVHHKPKINTNRNKTDQIHILLTPKGGVTGFSGCQVKGEWRIFPVCLFLL